MFRRYLIGMRLTSWNALLTLLATIQFTQDPDESCWNLCGIGKFLVDSMYRVLVHSELPVDDNKKYDNEDCALTESVYLVSS